ncbi:DnaB-like helicase N-terminal domain-containing protein [Pilimelia columellifera]|uniref:DNA helicase DnaB-like N-terminal domain-containing protein n=1 Tax=Pilimelia columellifera subsp. columellifera TaxID=706583 RepID=A0ABN3NJC5_9ACTN
MTTLNTRAEQALLGALLAEPVPATAEFAHLRPDDFGNSLHTAVYTAITETRTAYPHLASHPLAEQVAERVNTEGIDAGWLGGLRDACPEPRHAAAYARMVIDASLRRDINQHAARITTNAAASRDVDGAAHLNRLAAALARQAQINAALIEAELDDDAAPRHAALPEPQPAAQVDPARVMVEEELIADLIHNPDQARQLGRFLHSDTFTSPQRREIYEAVVSVAFDGGPVDELIIGWQVEQTRAADRAFTDLPTALWSMGVAPETDQALLARLVRTRPARTAVELGRDLLTEDVRQRLAGRLATLAPITQPPPRPGNGLDPHLRPPRPTDGHHFQPRRDQ